MKTFNTILKFHFLWSFCLFLSLNSSAQLAPAIDFVPIASGFNLAVDIASSGDDRLFIVEQNGTIQMIDTAGNAIAGPFMDIDAQVNSVGNEQGLLGLVFHPDYAANGYFYVNYTNLAGNTTISRWSVSSTDPNSYDPSSELVLMNINQPFWNHNAGDLEFGPDGYLYIPLGDGGSFGDPGNRSQNPGLMLGKILRIDVDGGTPYAIPADNPFVSATDTLDEIWSLGWRNPWRFCFDTSGNMWVADVGQDNFEEVHFEAAGSAGGGNYGWRCYEGESPYNTTGCAPVDSYVSSTFVYPHSAGQSITGGFVYEGANWPALDGWYFFADFLSGRHWATKANVCTGELITEEIDHNEEGIGTFGLDSYNELYAASLYTGEVFRVVDACSQYPIPEITLEDEALVVTGAGTGNIQWYESCEPVTGANDTLYASVLFDSVYFVTVTYPDGCVRVSPWDIIAQPTLGLDPLDKKVELSVKPNPASQLTAVVFESSFNLENPIVAIYNLTGQKLMEELLPSGLSGRHTLDVSELPAGFYQVLFSTEEIKQSQKLLIQR